MKLLDTKPLAVVPPHAAIFDVTGPPTLDQQRAAIDYAEAVPTEAAARLANALVQLADRRGYSHFDGALRRGRWSGVGIIHRTTFFPQQAELIKTALHAVLGTSGGPYW